jgi:HSP20 family protein
MYFKEESIMMLMPRKKEMDLFDEMFSDPFFSMKESRLMKTDIKEIDDGYEIEVDLPGYNKEDIQLEIDNGYLTVTAKKDEEEEDKKKKYIHKERYIGECSRSFFVGKDVKEEDIKAKFKNGTLKLTVPKKDENAKSEKKNIPIE